jgi:hypothetical protein
MEVGGQDPNKRTGCQYTPNGGAVWRYSEKGGTGPWGFSGEDWVEITSIEFRDSGQGAEFTDVKVQALNTSGSIVGTQFTWELVYKGDTFGMMPKEGDECGGDENGTPMPPVDAFDPIDYTDPETNCTYITNLLGFVEPYQGGPTSPVFVIRGADSQRADGGRIGGCNFEPVIYYPGPGGGGSGGGGGGGPDDPIVIPYPGGGGGDGGDGPGGGGGGDWITPLINALGGAGGAIIGNLLMDLVKSQYPGLMYRMVSVCEKDASGEPISEAVEVPIPTLPAPDAQLARLDAIVELLQASKNFKQPICGKDKPPLAGQWVTTRWESIEKMADSGRRLRKLFRYRTDSSRDLGQLSAYWEQFVWRAGPVCVRHTGAWWGDPQVWAESAEEGKRVIRHAATEAGIDPDQTGEWAISSSRSPRYGMSGTMKILRHEGFPWVASRDGANWPNKLAQRRDP